MKSDTWSTLLPNISNNSYNNDNTRIGLIKYTDSNTILIK